MPDGNTDPSFTQIASAIMAAIPRIDRIQLYQSDYGRAGALSERISIPSKTDRLKTESDYASVLSLMSKQPEDTPKVYSLPAIPDHYVLAVQIENENVPSAILLTIDAQQLVRFVNGPEKLEFNLRIGDETVYARPPHDHGFISRYLPWLTADLNPERMGHDLKIRINKHVELDDVLNWREIALLSIVSLAALIALHFAMRQRAISASLYKSELSARRQVELLQHENRLVQASRINAVGELASGIAHELTQPLTALLSQSEAGLAALGRTEDLDQDLVRHVLTANAREARRAGRILNRMREYIVGKDTDLKPHELNPIVLNMIQLVEHQLKDCNIDLFVELASPSPRSVVGAIELEQVIHNVLRNSIDALTDDLYGNRKIHVRTFSQNDKSIIEIADNGPGLSEDVLRNLFRAFFTTKENGMGLGLSLCAKLLERSKGSITASNNSGATFRIQLPNEGSGA
ncbi:ATP-binding protein [Bradyrhizobium sp. LTSPM299]|uniref:sensor histidine kinase n=1 Tax=Bradyrhizobium sp. LTSPM299 TaxID=1619233 RepID=UPI0018CDD5A8|nr:ATP-binding protein [Bradyrhizobium sp. LTSPM299]